MLFALVLGLLTAAANMVGSYLAVMQRAPKVSMMNALIGVSGGFILAVALLEIVPEALDGGGALIPLMIVAGYLLMYVTEQYFAAHAHGPELVSVAVGADAPIGEHTLHAEFQHEPRPITRQAAVAAFAGFLVHDFLDGLAIGAGILTNPAVGVMIFLGVLLHEVPVGLSVATLMRSAGNSRRVSFLSGVAVGLITLPGILLPFLVGGVDEQITRVFLGLAAGTFLYVSTTILIPAAGIRNSRFSVFSVVGGALLFWGVSVMVGEVLG